MQYVVEELEVACGAGTESRLILCAESDILDEYLKLLEPTVGSSVIGTVERNLCRASSRRVADLTRPILQRACVCAS